MRSSDGVTPASPAEGVEYCQGFCISHCGDQDQTEVRCERPSPAYEIVKLISSVIVSRGFQCNVSAAQVIFQKKLMI